MKRLHPGTLGAVLLVAIAGLAGLFSPLPVSATLTIYNFENLSFGVLSNQDNWVSIFTSGTQVQVAAPGGSGDSSAKAAVAAPGRDFLLRRNDANFSFPTIPTTGIVDFQADLRMGGSAGFLIYSAAAGLLPRDLAFRFYLSPGEFQFIRNDGTEINTLYPGRIGATDWLRVRVEANMALNTASMYYQDLTLGDPSFSLVTVPFTFVSAGTPAPGTWNTMALDLTSTAADNLLIESVPEPSSVLLMLAGGLVTWRLSRRR